MGRSMLGLDRGRTGGSGRGGRIRRTICELMPHAAGVKRDPGELLRRQARPHFTIKRALRPENATGAKRDVNFVIHLDTLLPTVLQPGRDVTAVGAEESFASSGSTPATRNRQQGLQAGGRSHGVGAGSPSPPPPARAPAAVAMPRKTAVESADAVAAVLCGTRAETTAVTASPKAGGVATSLSPPSRRAIHTQARRVGSIARTPIHNTPQFVEVRVTRHPAQSEPESSGSRGGLYRT